MKIKRTYNLSESTVRRVRDLAGEYRVSETQDGVVETAVEHLYHEERARQEAEVWAAAQHDPDFQAEVAAVTRDLEDRDSWPA